MKALKSFLFPLFVAWPVLIGLLYLDRDFGARFRAYGVWGDLIQFVVAVVPVAFGLAVLERLIPFRQDWAHSKKDFRMDSAYLLLAVTMGAQAKRILGTGLVVALAGKVAEGFGGAPWPSELPILAQLVLALLVSELGHYVVHRLGHEIPFLWKFHAVHHSSQNLYWLNASRFHFLELLALGLVQVAPLILLGCGKEVFMLYGGVTTIFGWLQHCNVDFRTGWFNFLISTPELHRWHHSKVLAEGNRNYGSVLSIWDILFGTLFWKPGHQFMTQPGLKDDDSFPEKFWAQQAAPLGISKKLSQISALFES